MQYFQQYQERLSDIIGPEQTQALVTQSLTLITLGGNDFVNNYYLVPFSARSRQFALPDYVVYLISEYRKVLAVGTTLFILPFPKNTPTKQAFCFVTSSLTNQCFLKLKSCMVWTNLISLLIYI